ncbi:MAG: hypothetical protein AAGD43_37165 [Pseudomonadota bacterium]
MNCSSIAPADLSPKVGNDSFAQLNAIKKYQRAITNTMGNSETLEEIEANLREEIGDVLICLDRVAECFGEDIEPAAREKFNKTSRKVGLPVLIPEDLV